MCFWFNSIGTDTTSPLTRKKSMICEKLHVLFDYDDYNRVITKTLNDLYTKLFSDKRMPLFTNSNQKFVKSVIKDRLFIDTVQIYVSIDKSLSGTQHDAVTYAYDTSHEPIVSCEQPLAIVQNNEVVKASIIISLSPDVCKGRMTFCQHMSKIIGHELMHVYHETTGVNLNKYAGDAYYFAEQFCDVHFIPFNITYDDLCEIKDMRIPNKVKAIQIYSALMYYCDPSEMSAFMQTLNQESKELVYSKTRRRIKNPVSKQDIAKDYSRLNTYRLYSLLYDFLVQYQKDLQHIKQDIRSSGQDILDEYFNNIKHFDNQRIESLPVTWLHKIQIFLKKAQTVHANNVMKRFKDIENE